MKNEVLKFAGNLLRDGFTGQNEEIPTVLYGAAAFIAPYVFEVLRGLPDKATTFADHVMENRYRFKAGPVVLEPANTTE